MTLREEIEELGRRVEALEDAVFGEEETDEYGDLGMDELRADWKLGLVVAALCGIVLAFVLLGIATLH